MFELIFVLTCLTVVGGVTACAAFLFRGRKERAGRLARYLAAIGGGYMAVVVLSSLAIPRQEYAVGEPRCLDDWCITVTSFNKMEAPPRYVVGIRLTNQARRTPMGEKGTVGFLVDASRRRYDPIPMPSDIAYATKVQPGQSLNTSRTFDVPLDAKVLGFIYTHEGGFPIDWLIIGGGGWFQGPPVVWLQR